MLSLMDGDNARLVGDLQAFHKLFKYNMKSRILLMNVPTDPVNKRYYIKTDVVFPNKRATLLVCPKPPHGLAAAGTQPTRVKLSSAPAGRRPEDVLALRR